MPEFSGGFVSGLQIVILSISFASLIFAAPLPSALPLGIGFSLLGVLIVLIIAFFKSKVPTLFSAGQTTYTVMAAVVVAHIVAHVPNEAALLPTVFMGLALLTLTFGAGFYLMGLFKAGNLAQYIPFPVLGGYTAGVGWLFIYGAVSNLLPEPLQMKNVADQLSLLELWVHWLPAVVYSFVMFFVLKRYKQPFMFVLLLVLGFVLFYLMLYAIGINLNEAKDLGLMMPSVGQGGLIIYPPNWQESLVSWQAIQALLDDFLIFIPFAIMGMILTLNSYELVEQKELETNHELKVAGLGNILAAPFGALGAHQHMAVSLMGRAAGAKTRKSLLVVIVICVVMIFGGAAVLSYIPKALSAAILIYLGIELLYKWLYKAIGRVGTLNYIVILLIVFLIGYESLITGIIVGLVISLLVFIYRYSRVVVIRLALPGTVLKSQVVRDEYEQHILKKHGNSIYIYSLQGYLFFGNTDHLLDKFKQVEQITPIRYLIVDFTHVSGFDSTTYLSFMKLQHKCAKSGVKLIFTGLNPYWHDQVSRFFHLNHTEVLFSIFDQFEYGLEWCEEQLIIEKQEKLHNNANKNIECKIAQILPALNDIESLYTYLDRASYVQGELLYSEGEDSDELSFLVSGVVEVRIKSHHKESVRLSKMRDGVIIGEMGYYMKRPRSANIICMTDVEVFRLTRSQFEKLRLDHPGIARAIDETVINIIAKRLEDANNLSRRLRV